MNNTVFWKALAEKLIIFVRFLFLCIISVDFFITMVALSSQRALIFTGFGAMFHPYAIIIWLILILGLTTVLMVSLKQGKLDHHKFPYFAYIFLILAIMFYTGLIVLAIISPAVAWPIMVAYAINIMLSFSLIYFRNVFMKQQLLDELE